MKTVIAGLSVLVAAMAVGVWAVVSSGEQPAKVEPATPWTAVAVTQCNLLVALFITSADGKLITIDKESGVSSADALRMGQKAKTATRIEVACDKAST